MRPLRPVLLAAAAVAAAACSDAGPVAPPPSPGAAPLHSAAPGRAVEGSYLVVVKRGADPRAVAAAAGVEPALVYGAALGGFAAELGRGQLEALRRHPAVEYVEQDQVVETASVPWGLDRIDQRNLPLDGMFRVQGLGSGVNVYLIDNGIHTPHPAFGGRAQNVFNATGGPLAPCDGHGTHVAGIVGSSTHGVARGTRLRGVIALSCNGAGTLAQVVAAVDWVRANHVKPAAANVSLVAGKSMALNDAVGNLVAAGVFTSVAAGNDNRDACLYSPASAPAAYTVGATTVTDGRAAFSNHGGCLDIFAPGQAIPSTWPTGGTNTISGTSMASAHVAGVAALLLGWSPTGTPSYVASWITGNATTGVLSGVPAGTPNRLLYMLGL